MRPSASFERADRHVILASGVAVRLGAAPISDLHPESHLDDGVLRNLEEIRRPARDPVEEREHRKGERLHRRSRLAANDGLVRDVIVLVIEIGIEAELAAVDQAERNIRRLHETCLLYTSDAADEE